MSGRASCWVSFARLFPGSFLGTLFVRFGLHLGILWEPFGLLFVIEVFWGLFFSCVFESGFSGSWSGLGSLWAPFWVAFGGLFCDFIEIWGLCWIALTLQPNTYFIRFGRCLVSTSSSTFQVLIPGCVFERSSWTFYDLWGHFWHPFASCWHFLGRILDLGAGWV